MHKYRRIWVVFRKELLDTLRDRRTLIAMVVVPVVLYPILMLVLLQALRSEKGRREAEQYRVCVPDERHRDWLEHILRRQDASRAALRREARESGGDSSDAGANLSATIRGEQVRIDVVGPDQSLWDLVAERRYHLGVLANPPPDPKDIAGWPNHIVQLIYTDTDPLSEFAYHRIESILGDETERIIAARLANVKHGRANLQPLPVSGLSTVSPDKQYAKILAAIVPFLLVIMTVTGAMYPAIDLTAGERERGTLETLAVSPVPTGQIVAGKFFVVLAIAMMSTALNLGSMTAMIRFTKLDKIAASFGERTEAESREVERMIEQAPAGESKAAFTQNGYLARKRALAAKSETQAGFVTKSAPIVLLAMVPFGVFFSAVMLVVCSFARTFKEAQNYMMPVMMAAIIPAMVVSYMPSVRLEGLLTVVPVANMVVLIRELFLGTAAPSAAAVALLSTCLYAATAIAAAARLYGHEAVLFSDVGSYKTLLRRRYFMSRPGPSVAEALLLVAILFPANFYWQSAMLDAGATPERAQLVLAVGQILTVAGPALLAAWYLRLNMRRTFSMARPRAIHVAGAILLGLSAAPVSLLLHRVQARILGDSGGVEALEKIEQLLSQGSTLQLLLVIAIVPAICEELLFRGWLLAGLRDRMRRWQTIVAVGLIFGLYHVVAEKIPQVSLMGMLLAFVCLRSNCIFLAMLIHAMHNGLPVLASRIHALESIYRFHDAAEASAIVDVRTVAFAAVFVAGLVLFAIQASRPRSESLT